MMTMDLETATGRGPGISPGPSLLDRIAVSADPRRLYPILARLRVRAAAFCGIMVIPSLLVGSATVLLTSIGAAALTQHEVAKARQLAERAAPVLAARARVIRLNDEVRAAAPLFARPTVSASIERVARALPSDAHIGSIAVEADGSLALSIDTTDPDMLRDALREDPLLAGLRERNQAGRPDGHIRVTLDGRGL